MVASSSLGLTRGIKALATLLLPLGLTTLIKAKVSSGAQHLVMLYVHAIASGAVLLVQSI
jgi:hypothetical protein